MKDLLTFVDDFVFEPQLYFRVNSLYHGDEFEVQWRTTSQLKWRLRPLGHESWTDVGTDGLVSLMNAHNLNLSEFELKLRSTLLQQVAYADSFVGRAKDIFGSDTVAEAIDANKEFISELQKAIQGLLGDQSPEPEGQASELEAHPKEGRLSIVESAKGAGTHKVSRGPAAKLRLLPLGSS